MSKAKEKILANIQQALKDVPEEERPKDVTVPRKYRQKGELAGEELVSLFAKRMNEYEAKVIRSTQKELTDIIAESCRREQVENLIIPTGFPEDWLPDSITPVRDTIESPLTHQELNESDGVITLCALAIAQTGTIILDAGKGQGRRVLTLLPDYHICIVREQQIVELVTEGFAHFDTAVKDAGPPITFISGPSATSDIELSRVEGVHGPRRLEVVIVS